MLHEDFGPRFLGRAVNKPRASGIYTSRIRVYASPDSVHELALAPPLNAPPVEESSEREREVMELFQVYRTPLLRYARSFQLSLHDSEEVVQEVFCALFRHLRLGRSRRNLRGWIFRVAHNLALKQRYANQRWCDSAVPVAEEHCDSSPNPEEQLSLAQRQQFLLAVVNTMPETDRNCLRLRAEGLRYREIASVLGISLGAVSNSLTRSMARLMRAEGS